MILLFTKQMFFNITKASVLFSCIFTCEKILIMRVKCVTEIAGEIYPEKHEITAPKPKLIETAWYVSENSEYESTLALNLTWSQTGAMIILFLFSDVKYM